jgi:hypothetical protein
MSHPHIMGYIVRRLREMGAAGASGAALLAYLRARHLEGLSRPFDYLSTAFLQPSNRFVYILTGQSATPFLPDELSRLIDERRSEWKAQDFPELIRVQDYLSFSRFAAEEQVVVNVCGADPFAARFLRSSGFRCYNGRAFVTSRRGSPHEGLICADPGDRRLRRALEQYLAPITYAEYVDVLRGEGLRVMGADTGFVVEDAAGSRFFEGYRLHSVYYPQTGRSAWTSARGETLRASINRHLGQELVRIGPLDDWQFRNDQRVAGPLRGPSPPFIEFRPDGEIGNYLTFGDLLAERGAERPWVDIYPVFHRSPEGGAHG